MSANQENADHLTELKWLRKFAPSFTVDAEKVSKFALEYLITERMTLTLHTLQQFRLPR